jgi:hypothetical protein
MSKVTVSRRLVELLVAYLQQTQFSVTQPKEVWDDVRAAWDEAQAALQPEASPKEESSEG